MTADMATTTAVYSANPTATHNMTTAGPTETNIWLMSAYCVVLALGILGNILCVTALVVSKEYKRSALHSYILHLALSDMMFLLQIPPLLLDLSLSIVYTDALCKVKYYALYVCFYSSILFLTVISMDRFVAICCPYSPKLSKLREPRATTIIIILVWVISLLSSIDLLLYAVAHPTHKQCVFISTTVSSDESSTLNTMTTTTATTTTTETIPEACRNMTYPDLSDCLVIHDPDYYVCRNQNKFSCKLIYVNFIVYFCLPLVVMIFTFGSIIRQLRRSSNRLTATYKKGSQSSKASVTSREGSKRSNQEDKARELEMRVTKMSIALVSTFFICSLPFHVFQLSIIPGLKISMDTCMTLSYTVSILGFANSALNPYLYGFLGTEALQRIRKARSSIRSSFTRTSNTTVRSY